MSFSKIFKTAKGVVKSTIDTAISNNMTFSVQVVPLSNSDFEFPPDDETFKWAETYVNEALKFKPLNGKALEGMLKKWKSTHPIDVPFVAKKQPSEIITVLISPSENHLHVFYSIPDYALYKIEAMDTMCVHDGRKVYYQKITPPKETSVFKYRDDVFRNILNDMKTQGIFNDDDDDDDDEVVNYLD